MKVLHTSPPKTRFAWIVFENKKEQTMVQSLSLRLLFPPDLIQGAHAHRLINRLPLSRRLVRLSHYLPLISLAF